MKKLFYVPIIHMSADMGTLAKDVTERGVAGLGENFWKMHIETIQGFWRSLEEFFGALPLDGFKIYQDGMVADGEVAKKIVEEGLKSGSKNYEIVAMLVERGAMLIKTEDFILLKKERDRLVSIIASKSRVSKVISYIRYMAGKGILLKKRDRFIADRIRETLKDGETGILFIGAYHDVTPFLPSDVEIIWVKDIDKVRRYQRMSLLWSRRKEEVGMLADYLISPVLLQRKSIEVKR